MMKMKQVKELTDSELDHTYDELLKESLNLKIQSRTGQLQNSARIRQIRKEIARINTEKKLRRVASASA